MPPSDYWLSLAIGNSRLHWALFEGTQLQHTWDTPYLSERAIAFLAQCDVQDSGLPELRIFPPLPPQVDPFPLWMASVVPQQTLLWEIYPDFHRVELEEIPLEGLYPTLGIDRALTLWGAVHCFGSPALVIDAGTAFTFTAVDEQLSLFGGAILPGLQLQIQALVQGTAALPLPALLDCQPMSRWATRTPDAIRSGVVFGLLATVQDFIHDWLTHYPDGAIALTGGDGPRLHQYLQRTAPALAQGIVLDPGLLFRGLPAIRYGWESSALSQD